MIRFYDFVFPRLASYIEIRDFARTLAERVARAYAVSEVFGWKSGLTEKPGRAKQFYAVIAVSTLIGMGINFLGINAMSVLFWTAVINGFLAPPLLVAIMVITNNRAVMGDRVNGRALNVIGWATTGIMFAAAIGLIWTWATP